MDITMMKINYSLDPITKMYRPTRYPIEPYGDYNVPKEISKDFRQLTSITESKYTREYLKVCAFYNKLFPTLKNADWSQSTYNAVPFTVQDQERTDTGTGLTANYLKSAIDTVVARIGNNRFDYKLVSDRPTVEYTIYKDEIERLLNSVVKKNDLQQLGVECFHDAAILGYSHAFLDPWTCEIRKIPDWEYSAYESEISNGKLTKVLIRDFAFPVSALAPYVEGFEEEKIKSFTNSTVDLQLYIDTELKKKYVAINNQMAAPTDYPFDEVLISTMCWDLGIKKVTTTSLFDLLYPIQRQINKLLAKKHQLLAMYKGPVPIFSGATEPAVKQLSNAAGEVLFLDTQRNPADLVHVVEPTPLDPQLNAEMEALKSQMFELAGVQMISMDIENYRTAASYAAMEQMRDAGFQTPLTLLANFIRDIILMNIKYNSVISDTNVGALSWQDIENMMQDAYIDVKPIQKIDLAGRSEDEPVDFIKRHIEQFVIRVCQGSRTFDDVDFSFDYEMLKQSAAMRLIEYKALNDDSQIIMRLQQFLIDCFVEDIKRGLITLNLTEMPHLDMIDQNIEEGVVGL